MMRIASGSSRAGWAVRLWLVALLLGAGLAATARDALAQDAPDRPVLLLDIKGPIGFVSAERLEKALEKAQALDASALIVRLDTPGGLLSSTRDMIQAI